MEIVTVHRLKKYFGKGEAQVKALDGIDLSIEKGRFTAIIGASGSGKTTLLNMIGGLDTPDEGEVIVDGVNLSGLKERELAVFRRGKVGFVYQNFNLVPTLTVKENILFPLSLAGSTPDRRFFGEVVGQLFLEDRLNAYPHQLSGGDCQGAAWEAGHSSGRRTYGKPGCKKRTKCVGAFENVCGDLSSDPHYDHPQP